MTNDASHITAADQSLTSIQRAIVQCLRSGGLHPEQVQYINAHGTATLKNDSTEAAVIEHLFPHQPFVSSSKGAIGHCLGAGGIMEAIICLLAIRDQHLPPCVGLKTPAFNLNLVRDQTKYPLKIALNLSFGFGGQNTALALG
jgi:3-oxoacyl-[acyl-carrier-protein] synthase II